MPKMKTNRAANKRYSFTGTKKVKRTKANRRHLLANKTKRQKTKMFFCKRQVSAYKEKNRGDWKNE